MGSQLGGSSEEVALVKISTATPRRASTVEVLRMYTFIPPASPLPGCAHGEVCTDNTATRRGCVGGRPTNAETIGGRDQGEAAIPQG